ncbi:hypothetical protein RJ641_010409 [Dillenia turbinata]|uniref:Uncharacterized protein n=1 Tax=Dillenia turbinata TaxID=194707 RepID=A0AAN8Z2M4_9MAGN
MGACATKPKGLKAEDVQPPEPVAEEQSTVVTEVKEVEVAKEIEVTGEDEVKKESNEVDDQGNKRRSLSLLFQQNEEAAKELTEKEDTRKPENALAEPTKEELPKTQTILEESKTDVPEAEKTITVVEETPIPDAVDAPKEDKTPKTAEATPSTEPQPEKSEEKKNTAEEEKQKSEEEDQIAQIIGDKEAF